MKKLSILLFTLLCLVIGKANAQYTVLHYFNGSNGSNPSGSLLFSNNKFYGLTVGGLTGYGCIFSMDIDGSGYKDMFDFNGTNGYQPNGSFILIGNTLYGMTDLGGANNYGVIFSIDTTGSPFKLLYNFNGTDGANGVADLTSLGNKFYGMASSGSGATFFGTVFSIDSDGNGYKNMMDFNGTNGGGPDGDLTPSGSHLFGMTQIGGGTYGRGCVFSIDTNGNGFKPLIYFNDTNGATPYGSLVLSNGKLFGMTMNGGADSDGCIFSIDTDGSRYKRLHDFDGFHGANPVGSLILSENILYGMARYGGAYGWGCIFSIDTNGNNYIDLFDFHDSDGAFPEGSLTLLGGVLYGMTDAGGIKNLGVIFSFKDSITGINELTSSSGAVNVYPNPNNGKFTIQSSVISPKSLVEVYNMFGEMIYSTKLNSANTQVDLSNNSNGVYLYRVISATGDLVSEGKFIKE
ncbi:MAG TPA: choice-of-anchor tandem repeat GloVer-containing protein [Bacteroidia bacterium]|jgi:uncharacterized repeat protein (TIGR03803 family)|nr:choice-of-anchor tandem repeat GloVer-containing protein [Bacteroidia bacterium]